MKTHSDSFNGWSTNVILGSVAWLVAGVLSLWGVIEVDLVELFFLLAPLAFLMIFITTRVIRHRLAEILLTVSAFCLIIGMAFTYLYAVSEFTGYYWVVIPQMVKFHGLTNAFGFALGGLLACNILQSQRQAASLYPIVESGPGNSTAE